MNLPLSRREVLSTLGGGFGGLALASLLHADQPAAPSLADRKSTRLNSSHIQKSRMPSSA